MKSVQALCTFQAFTCLVCQLIAEIVQPSCHCCAGEKDVITIQGNDAQGGALRLNYHVPGMKVTIEGDESAINRQLAAIQRILMVKELT